MLNLPISNPNRRQQLPEFLLPSLLEVLRPPIPSASLCVTRAFWLLVRSTVFLLQKNKDWDFRCWVALDGEVLSHFSEVFLQSLYTLNNKQLTLWSLHFP